MSETALYYTLSTVSQTLAGALGMLAAFLALRVAALEAAFRGISAELEQRIRAGGFTMRGSMADTLKGWRVEIGEAALAAGPINTATGYNVHLFRLAEHNHVLKAALLRQATSAFAASAAVMAACFVGLVSTPWLSCARPRAWIAAIVAIVGGIACLAWYGRIVREALE